MIRIVSDGYGKTHNVSIRGPFTTTVNYDLRIEQKIRSSELFGKSNPLVSSCYFPSESGDHRFELVRGIVQREGFLVCLRRNAESHEVKGVMYHLNVEAARPVEACDFILQHTEAETYNFPIPLLGHSQDFQNTESEKVAVLTKGKDGKWSFRLKEYKVKWPGNAHFFAFGRSRSTVS